MLLAALERRAVDRDQHLRPALGEGFRDFRKPPILADHQAEAEAAERHRAGGGAGVEDALLVEHAVIGQLVLGAARGDAAIVEQEQRVVQPAAVTPRTADHECRAAVGGLGGEGRDGRFAIGDEGGLADQVLGRIAADRELGGDDEIGAEAGGFRAGGADAGDVGLDLPEMEVDLGECDAKGLTSGRHGRKLGAGEGARNECGGPGSGSV